MQRCVLIRVVALMLAMSGPVAFADVPQTMSFQGRLTATDGSPLSDGTYELIFTLYPDSLLNDFLWQEVQIIEVVNGLFEVQLGSAVPLPLAPFIEITPPNLYLGIAVGENPEMLPRVKLSSTGYAIQASHADDAGWAMAADHAAHAESVADSCISGISIRDGSIGLIDLGQNGAAPGQIIKWTPTGWAIADDDTASSSADGDWVISGNDMYSGVSGNVGIGTTNPQGPFHVDFGATGSVRANTPLGNGPGWTFYAPNGYRRDIVAGNGALGLGAANGSYAPSYSHLTLWNNGRVSTGFDTTTTHAQFSVKCDTGTAGYFESGYLTGTNHAVIEANYTGTAPYSGAVGVKGVAKPLDYIGTGGYFEGGHIGVRALVEPTDRWEYVGVAAHVDGGTGTNQALSGWSEYGNRGFGAMCKAAYGVTNYGCCAAAENGDTAYGVVGSAKYSTHVSYGVKGEALSDGISYAGHFTSSHQTIAGDVLYAKYDDVNLVDAVAIHGYSRPADFYGYGGLFEGGYVGAKANVDATGSDTYYGFVSRADGGSGTNYGLFASASGAGTNYAGYFSGDVEVTGTITKSGSEFKIDHPDDPANKTLSHASVASPEMKNVYDGVVVLDAQGMAAVELPPYFESLNGDFRYQLTCIGGYASVYISQEISGNSFTIAGGNPGLKVSWQVTGIRKDPFAITHPVTIEKTKSPDEIGKYVNPEAFGRSPEDGIAYVRSPKK